MQLSFLQYFRLLGQLGGTSQIFPMVYVHCTLYSMCRHGQQESKMTKADKMRATKQCCRAVKWEQRRSGCCSWKPEIGSMHAFFKHTCPQICDGRGSECGQTHARRSDSLHQWRGCGKVILDLKKDVSLPYSALFYLKK